MSTGKSSSSGVWSSDQNIGGKTRKREDTWEDKVPAPRKRNALVRTNRMNTATQNTHWPKSSSSDRPRAPGKEEVQQEPAQSSSDSPRAPGKEEVQQEPVPDDGVFKRPIARATTRPLRCPTCRNPMRNSTLFFIDNRWKKGPRKISFNCPCLMRFSDDILKHAFSDKSVNSNSSLIMIPVFKYERVFSNDEILDIAYYVMRFGVYFYNHSEPDKISEVQRRAEYVWDIIKKSNPNFPSKYNEITILDLMKKSKNNHARKVTAASRETFKKKQQDSKVKAFNAQVRKEEEGKPERRAKRKIKNAKLLVVSKRWSADHAGWLDEYKKGKEEKATREALILAENEAKAKKEDNERVAKATIALSKSRSRTNRMARTKTIRPGEWKTEM
jgi:hypothetical protein